MEPQSIAHYRITGKLGEGGMGAVYRAVDTKLNREVAIKVIPDAFAQDRDRMARFEREARGKSYADYRSTAAVPSATKQVRPPLPAVKNPDGGATARNFTTSLQDL